MGATGALGRPALVGRGVERDVLEETLRGAREGRGRALFVTGEDGIGKSGLALEAAALGSAHRMRVLRGRASPTCPAPPLRPLTEALACLFRHGRGPDGRRLEPYREALGRLIPEYGSGGSGGSDGSGGSGGDSPVLLAESVLRLVCADGAGRGCLLVLEDLHDADPQTLAVVEYLADNIAEQGMALLVTVRHGPGPCWDLAQALARRRSCVLMRLGRLGREEVRRLAAAQLGVDAADLPDDAVDRLCRDSGGNPFLAEELLHTMVGAGALVAGPQGYRLVDGVRTEIPSAVGRSIARRAGRLGPVGHRLLSAAAVIGVRFPVSVLQRSLDITESDALDSLRAAVATGLLTPDGPTSDWYAFRAPVTPAALLSQLIPTERAAVARRAAEVAEELHPGLPGEWCRFAAALSRRAEDADGAARLYAEAGRRALATGRAEEASGLLKQAWEAADDSDDAQLRCDVLDGLLSALDESDEAGHGRQLAESLDELAGPGVDSARVAALHVRLARLACAEERWDDGLAQVNAARALLGARAQDRHSAPVDAVEAQLLEAHAPGRARQLAVRATDLAERSGPPDAACRAWRIRGALARQAPEGDDEAARCFGRMRTLADEHDVPLWRLHAALETAVQQWLFSGDPTELLRVGRHARRLGATTVRHAAGVRLALDQVLRGEYAAAWRVAGSPSGEGGGLMPAAGARRLAVIRVVGAGHQGRRGELDRALGEFRALGGGPRSPLSALTYGLGGAVCALLEEDRGLARDELGRAAAQEAVSAAPCPLAGRHGLTLLLEVLSGEAGRSRYGEVTASQAARMRWNHQFVTLARAVLLGRRGRGDEAAAAVADAQVLARPYPMAAHLGLRLVAEAAHTDGWGEPVGWLRRAEEHFHQAGVPAVAAACRGLLRHTGAVVPQHAETELIPRALRLLGVTRREYEVLRLLVDRPDNRGLAGRLFISPRTVEKHVASLITKTEQPNRAALCAYASRLPSVGRD